MVYTPNSFTTSTLCFLIQFKMKEQKQRIYFRKFCKKNVSEIKNQKSTGKILAKECIKSQTLRKFLSFKYDAINKYDRRRAILHFNFYKS